jgi:hypothetical protein
MTETWIRIVIYRIEGRANVAAIEYMKSSVQEVVRRLEKQAGFQLGYWGSSPETGTMAAVTYWSSRDAITRAESSLRQLHAERAAQGLVVHKAHNVRLFAGASVGALR